MAESPGPTRKPFFPNTANLAGYNRHLTESLGGLTDASEFGAFTLFPEVDGRPPHEAAGFVWQDLSSFSSTSPPSGTHSSVDVTPRSTFLPPTYEDFLKRSASEFSAPVNPLRHELSPPVNRLAPATGTYPTHNGFSPQHYPEENDFPHVLGLGETSQQGYDIYTKSLEDWNSFSPYSPFGVSDALSYTQTTEKDSTSKPSYSEVARSSKTKLPKAGRTESELGKKKDVIKPPIKPFKKSFSKQYHHPKSKSAGAENPAPSLPVHPDSKYGLDQFEDPVVLRRNPVGLEEKTSSAESLLRLSRQGSTSSLSSGGSVGEEVKCNKPVPTSPANSPYITAKMTSPEGMKRADTLSPENTEEKGSKSSQTSASEKTGNINCSGEGSKGPGKPFFDPRRIFQSKAYGSSSKKCSQGFNSTQGSASATVLNNGKLSYASKNSTTVNKHTSDYINNDLRDTKKSSSGSCSKKETDSTEKNVKDETSQGKHFHKQDKSRGVYNRQSSKLKSHNVSDRAPTTSTGAAGRDRQTSTRGPNFDQELIDEWLMYGQEKARWLCHQSWSVLVTIVVLLITLIAFLVSSLCVLVAKIGNKTWELIHKKLLGDRWGDSTKSGDSRQKLGLEENITLPTTGDEAMQRLLACNGKDPYSILGLTYEATDDEIKKYYKRQAVLVHPDKNQQPGAEEAFKILVHAFELIGEPDKRKQYNSQVHEANEAETAMQEFADLLTKLQEKIQEAANMMRCDNCGGKHRRFPVERAWYSARFCDRCNQNHSAKEGDVWAETSMLGFKWHYYACMEGKVFDITEWVACRREFFKHMQANAHHVFYRIATEGNFGHHHGRSGENDLEDFINHLVHRAMASESGEASQWGQQKNQSSWNSKDANSRRKRKKKKH